MCPPSFRLPPDFCLICHLLTGNYDEGGHMARPYEDGLERQATTTAVARVKLPFLEEVVSQTTPNKWDFHFIFCGTAKPP